MGSVEDLGITLFFDLFAKTKEVKLVLFYNLNIVSVDFVKISPKLLLQEFHLVRQLRSQIFH